jgi:uncharacterized protein (TIGR02246 family)
MTANEDRAEGPPAAFRKKAMESDEQQIRRVIDRWHRATAAGDLEGVLALMADDALFLTPGRPPMDREGFAAAFRGFSGRIRVDSKQDIREIHAAGDLAYCWSHISVVMTNVENGEESRRAGHVLTIFRRSAGGTWLLSRDANLLTAKEAPE